MYGKVWWWKKKVAPCQLIFENSCGMWQLEEFAVRGWREATALSYFGSPTSAYGRALGLVFRLETPALLLPGNSVADVPMLTDTCAWRDL